VTTQVKYKSPEGRSLCYIMRNNWRNMAHGGSTVTRCRRRRRRQFPNLYKRNTCFVYNFNRTFIAIKTICFFFA